MEIIGFFATALALVFANSGGVGGGGIMVPITIICFGFGVKQAIGISNATVFVSGLVRYVLNLSNSHPLKNGTGVLVDYTVASVMLPSIVVGVTAGGIVNYVFPAIYLAFALIVLILCIITSTWKKLC